LICLETFKNVHLSDFNNLGEWKVFLKRQEEYCKNNSTVWDWVPNLELPHSLPSIHPYWSHVFWKDSNKRIKRTIRQYKECYKDDNLLKFYFGYMSLDAVRLSIKKMIKENKEYKKEIKY
jgi:hypothetical protein